MTDQPTAVHDFSQLQQFVRETLSRLESLEPYGFELTHQTLLREGRPCGVYFCLHGPRAVRLTAIWETDSNSVLFYGSRGERVMRAKLDARLGIDSAESTAA